MTAMTMKARVKIEVEDPPEGMLDGSGTATPSRA